MPGEAKPKGSREREREEAGEIGLSEVSFFCVKIKWHGAA